jgi:hypothetical protein
MNDLLLDSDHDVLDRAIEALETFGFCKKAMIDRDGRVDATGALMLALGATVHAHTANSPGNSPGPFLALSPQGWQRLDDLRRGVLSHVVPETDGAPASAYLARANDRPWVTCDDVIEWLSTAAWLSRQTTAADAA